MGHLQEGIRPKHSLLFTIYTYTSKVRSPVSLLFVILGLGLGPLGRTETRRRVDGWGESLERGQKNKQFLCENYTNKHERIHSSHFTQKAVCMKIQNTFEP